MDTYIYGNRDDIVHLAIGDDKASDLIRYLSDDWGHAVEHEDSGLGKRLSEHMDGQKSESELEEANNLATIDSLIQLKAMMREKKTSLNQINTDDKSKLVDIGDIGFSNHYASDAEELKFRLLQD